MNKYNTEVEVKGKISSRVAGNLSFFLKAKNAKFICEAEDVKDEFWDLSSPDMEAFLRVRGDDGALIKCQPESFIERVEIDLPSIVVNSKPDHTLTKSYEVWKYRDCLISIYHVNELDSYFVEIESERRLIGDILKVQTLPIFSGVEWVDRSLFSMIKELSNEKQ